MTLKKKQMANKILIIEDEEKIARFIELELLHEGYEAEKCADGRTGLEKAENSKRLKAGISALFCLI